MISNSTTTWVHNNLGDQKQYVAVNGVFSDPSYISLQVYIRDWQRRASS